jgi:acyl-CoA synthetase (AMP-forming)/AMP-acid ligase II
LAGFNQGDVLQSLADVLDRRAAERPDKAAFVFVPERGGVPLQITFAQLRRRARSVAARLAARFARGERAVLLFPPGLDFIVAFFGCSAAGVIAVPLMVPRRTAARDSSTAIIADCSPAVAMTSGELLESRPDVADRFVDARFRWMTVDAMDDTETEAVAALPPAGDDIAFLQYTSGSTSTPKGVVVMYRNLLANLEMIRRAMGHTEHSTTVGWVPLYHDMGLMMQVMQPLYVGATSVLMAPTAFMQRPLNWLHMIHRYGAEVSTAPNFAFELCISRFRADQMQGVDLSRWKMAVSGAEPVLADTMARFAETFAAYGFDASSIYPAYGLAEATLLASGGVRGRGVLSRRVSRAALQRDEVLEPPDAVDGQPVVSCGHSLVGEEVAIADPRSCARLPACRVGEIWVSGPNVAAGYWQNRAASAETFEGCLDNNPGQRWLRTGDLGFLDEQGELFIAGRMKDLIIIRGMNHYPQDIERTVQECHPALRLDCGAAFAVAGAADSERLVIVQEVERTQRRSLDLNEVRKRIVEAVTRQHEISIETIVLIPPATLPKTTSGKIQRGLARKLWLEGALSPLE